MFNAQVLLRRNFSVFTRVPTSRIVQSAARDGHERITIHRIRIRKPFFSRQRLVGAVAIATATYGFGRYLGLQIEVEEEEVDNSKPGRWKKQVRKEDGTLDEVDDEQANKEEDDEDEEEYDDAILFFPTGLSRRKPRTLYKGSDPEWQEFKKLSRDTERIRRIRQELVDIVRKSYSAPAYKSKIGDVDHSKGRAWIEFSFPEGPPPGFERPGYELTEDLEWRKTTRDVEPSHHFRLHRLVWPTRAASALYNDTKRKAERTWNDFAVYIGWAEKNEQFTVQEIIKQATSPSSTAGSAADPATAASASPFGTSLPTATKQSIAPSTSTAAGTEKEFGLALPDPKALTLDLEQFRRDFLHGYRIVHNQPPGSFHVTGLIEVYGSRARLVTNVHAIYDPKKGRYVALQMSTWSLAPHQQSPRGGP